MIWYMYILQNDYYHNEVNIYNHHIFVCVCVGRTLKIYSQQLPNVLQLSAVRCSHHAVHYIPRTVRLITASLCLWPPSPIAPTLCLFPGVYKYFYSIVWAFSSDFFLFAKEMNPSFGFIPSFLCHVRPCVVLPKANGAIPTACHLKNRLIIYNPKKTCYGVKTIHFGQRANCPINFGNPSQCSCFSSGCTISRLGHLTS